MTDEPNIKNDDRLAGGGDGQNVDHTLTLIAALVQGDRWLSADACAIYLGLKPTKKGHPNRRGFLERVACRPDFPKPLDIGGQEKAWKKSEVDRWAEEQRRAA